MFYCCVSHLFVSLYLSFTVSVSLSIYIYIYIYIMVHANLYSKILNRIICSYREMLMKGEKGKN